VNYAQLNAPLCVTPTLKKTRNGNSIFCFLKNIFNFYFNN
jgi:hypothetical protein